MGGWEANSLYRTDELEPRLLSQLCSSYGVLTCALRRLPSEVRVDDIDEIGWWCASRSRQAADRRKARNTASSVT